MNTLRWILGVTTAGVAGLKLLPKKIKQARPSRLNCHGLALLSICLANMSGLSIFAFVYLGLWLLYYWQAAWRTTAGTQP